ncbi:hypothetical protein D3C85_1512290 [compost metagenome]
MFRLRLALNIDLPARQLSRKARILALDTDRERELIVRYDNAGHLLLLEHDNLQHFGRAERVRNIFVNIFRPADDIDLLAFQLADDRLYAHALRTDARTDRIHFAVAGVDCDFRTETRFTGDGTNLDYAVINFRNFQLEQPLQQAWMRP